METSFNNKKRSGSIPSDRSKSPAKKRKSKAKKKKQISIPKPSTSGLLRKNSFDALSKIDDDEIILIDSDSDKKVIDISSSDEKEKEQPQEKAGDEKDPEDIKHNADFIGFDFSDSEPEEDNEHLQDPDDNFEYDNFDEDNEYLSNDDGTYHKSPRPKLNNEYPWLQNHDHSSKIEIVDWLNMEIKDFVNYISPSKEEISIRNEVYKKIKYLIVTQLWNDCDVQVFGSFATDLYLPGSDIDLVITSPQRKYDTRAHLYQLSAFLRRSGLGINVETIAKAKVPIIKFVEPDSKIHIDVSFERTNGLDAAKNIRNWLSNTPGLRELVLIIKQFLAVRRLNNVHVGGLGGYSIICLVYSFLKLHPRLATDSIDPMENLGTLLIEFFEFYGLNFGYDNVALAFDPKTKEPFYLPKKLYPELMMRSSFAIAIRDPDDPSNNISRGSFNIRDIKRSFGGAFQLLANKCYELNQASYKTRLNESILGGVIKYKGKERDFEDARNDVTNEAMVYSDDDDEDIQDLSLPPLPSKARQRKINKKLHESSKATTTTAAAVAVTKSENDVHYYSEYSSEDDTMLSEIVKEAQDTQSQKAYSQVDKQKAINALFGIKSESEADQDDDDDQDEDGDQDDDSNTEESKNSVEDEEEKAKVEKTTKRDYWNQKGGL